MIGPSDGSSPWSAARCRTLNTTAAPAVTEGLGLAGLIGPPASFPRAGDVGITEGEVVDPQVDVSGDRPLEVDPDEGHRLEGGRGPARLPVADQRSVELDPQEAG